MINFRLRQEDVPRLDAAVKRSGMSRSDFIRMAVTEYVARMDGRDEALQNEGGRGKAKVSSTKGKFNDCPRNAACKIVAPKIGAKVCTTCGERW